MFDSSEPLNLELESLSPDFWPFELETQKKFIPKDNKSGKNLLFDLNDFINKAKKNKSTHTLYLGSQTTPPCLGTLNNNH